MKVTVNFWYNKRKLDARLFYLNDFGTIGSFENYMDDMLGGYRNGNGGTNWTIARADKKIADLFFALD